MYTKGFLPVILCITIYVLTSCASTKKYRDNPVNADSINCDRENSCTNIRTGKYFINVDGTIREFILTLPENYDNSRTYPLIFVWHGLGGSAIGVASGSRFRGEPYFGLFKASENQAIFIAGQGLSSVIRAWSGWDNKNGRDVAFVRKLMNWAELNMSIDESRIFSTGMSYGGMFSNLLACRLGNKIRAIASMSGSFQIYGVQYPYNQCKGEKVAAWFAHGTDDRYVVYKDGEAARDYFTSVNGCSSSFTKATPAGCIMYNGCDTGYPVVWCRHKGGHYIPKYAGEEIWNFFNRF